MLVPVRLNRTRIYRPFDMRDDLNQTAMINYDHSAN